MWHNATINLSDLLFSVSEAMDLSDATLVDHQIRTAYVSFEIARHLKLDYLQIERLFTAALLHDIGALSPEEKIGAHIYEDLRPEPHCLRGGKLFSEAFWLEPSARIVEWHHTPMDLHLQSGRTLADFDVLASQILYLADHLECAIQRHVFILHQTTTLRSRIHGLADKGAVHPDIVAAFDQISSTDDFWLTLVVKDLGRSLSERNILRSIDLDFTTVRSIACVFKDMTDFRSRFTATHSSGVAECARGIACVMSFSGKDLQRIEIAGLLHDVGKLVIPNAILCKNDKLSSEEYAVIRQHPFYTYRILSRVRGFEQIAEWAAFHHERMDGSGYCHHIKSTELDLGAKIIAVADVATAIAERRPYRDCGNEIMVLNALRGMADDGLLDRTIVAALADNYDAIMSKVRDAQAADEARYLARYAMID